MRQDLQRKVLTRGLHHEIDDPEGQEDDNQYPPEFDSPFFSVIIHPSRISLRRSGIAGFVMSIVAGGAYAELYGNRA